MENLRRRRDRLTRNKTPNEIKPWGPCKEVLTNGYIKKIINNVKWVEKLRKQNKNGIKIKQIRSDSKCPIEKLYNRVYLIEPVFYKVIN